MSIEKLKTNYPVQFKWVHFPLHPETPSEGKALKELFAGRDIAPMKERMKELMTVAGLPYGDRTHTYNSRLAQELGKWADTQLGGEPIHEKLYRAYFVDNINIGEINQLVDIAESCMLDGEKAREILTSRSFKAQVDADWQRSRENGITGVPTFFSNNLVVVGCQPYEVLEKFVKHLIQLKAKFST
ncbi:MAG: hypothetical protein CMQ32_07175 [Gammaproteobacteria bacterium]|nr:hypothetical protein [Gammaproteobacteria bacterium]MBE47598.1 hypothetical protein [Gammaproteobacteria bacterium]MCH2343036.1 DsbA family protein [Pseudomonadales bacterium]HAC88794.1 hypothetical protein [Gammaproteobacteria bacterium]HAD71657.1 hypothetical protein [Gammaproteobacteria bacterium]